jgi:membrane protein required for beta-lactamase induction
MAGVSFSLTVISVLIVGASLGLVGWLLHRLLRWARSGGRGAQALGSVLTEVTQSAVVREAKQDRKRKDADGGDPPAQK